jgi:hypothetical protein
MNVLRISHHSFRLVGNTLEPDSLCLVGNTSKPSESLTDDVELEHSKHTRKQASAQVRQQHPNQQYFVRLGPSSKFPSFTRLIKTKLEWMTN